MPAIVLEHLTGLTVSYNGVQFGGIESFHTSVPPTYSFVGDFVWDDSRRAIKGTKYVLTVDTIFYEATETAVAQSIADAESRLGAHGKVLTIAGLGTGFDGTYSPTPSQDILWGPKPIGIRCTSYGQLAWSCTWSVEFFIKQCVKASRDAIAPTHPPLAFTCFNFDTTWQNDFEGLCTRTIAGSVEIAVTRDDSGKIPKHVADEVRDMITVLCPNGFRRTTNTWRETQSKERLEFVVTDEAMPGDPLPEGLIMADGDISFNSTGMGQGGSGFNIAQVTLSMNARVSPDKPRGLAGQVFLTACITKTNAMWSAFKGTKGAVIPTGISLRQGKFNRARDFSGSFTWMLTRSINDMMKASGLWEPVEITEGEAPTYAKWRASVSNLWDNRGLKTAGVGLRSVASEAVVIDLCSNVTQITIGSTPYKSGEKATPDNPLFSCPNISPDGGWIGHEIKVSIVRNDSLTIHKKALSYLPTPGSVTAPSNPQTGPQAKVPMGGPSYTQSVAQQHDVEHNGYPTQYVLIQFKGLRLKFPPIMPEIKTVGGLPAYLVDFDVPIPKVAFDVLTCSAYYLAGWRLYFINGPIAQVSLVGSETSGSAPFSGSPAY